MEKKENLIFLFLKNKKFFTLRVSVKDSLEGGCAGEVYPRNLKNWKFESMQNLTKTNFSSSLSKAR
jgi:hypothetical protein